VTKITKDPLGAVMIFHSLKRPDYLKGWDAKLPALP
jgi:hypothetical protein